MQIINALNKPHPHLTKQGKKAIHKTKDKTLQKNKILAIAKDKFNFLFYCTYWCAVTIVSANRAEALYLQEKFKEKFLQQATARYASPSYGL